MKALIIFLLLVGSGLPKTVEISGRKIISRAFHTDEDQLSKLLESLSYSECEIIKEPRKLGDPTDYICDDHRNHESLERILDKHGIEREALIDDVDRVIDDHRRLETRSSAGLNFEAFPRYQNIERYLKDLAKSNSEFISLESRGKSYEGRDIYLIKIGNSPLGNQTRAVFIDGGIHAREWIAVTSALYVVDKLAKLFASECENRCFIFKDERCEVNWFIMPLLNPDGYEYSHTNKRLWRKNRRPSKSVASCPGVDLNRNFNVIGYGVGASDYPCSDTYKGTKPNSEPETRAAISVLLENRDHIRQYIGLHTYGQSVLTSWGYTEKKPNDNEKLLKIGEKLAKAFSEPNGRSYTFGQAGTALYIAGGASDDYSKAVAKIPSAVTVELPDKGRYGFLVPAEQIKSIGEETWNGIKAAAEVSVAMDLGPDQSQD